MTVTKYYPVLLLDWLTPVYDLFVRLYMPKKCFKRDLITHTRIARAHRVLEMSISSNQDGRYPYLFQDARSVNVAESSGYTTISGTISILSGQKPCIPIPGCL